jgi:hypothetical protein
MYAQRYYVACSWKYYGHGEGIIVFLFFFGIGLDTALNNITVLIVGTEMQVKYNKFHLDACRTTKYFVVQSTIGSVMCDCMSAGIIAFVIQYVNRIFSASHYLVICGPSDWTVLLSFIS